jgi:hypothetical protein
MRAETTAPSKALAAAARRVSDRMVQRWLLRLAAGDRPQKTEPPAKRPAARESGP